MTTIQLTYVFNDEDELRAHLAAETRAAPVAEVLDVTDPTVDVRTAAAPEPEITADVDADGLPYDEAIHATPKSQTADGLWRAKRGKSKEAEAARAAFKAAGGAVVAPVVAAAAMPVVAAAPVAAAAMPGMPVAAARAPEPITYDKLIDKTVGMMQRAKITSDGVMALYGLIGLTDPAVLETNESMRAALYGKLAEIEPDLA